MINITIDDRDSSIRYSGLWTHNTTVGRKQDTISTSQDSSATFTFSTSQPIYAFYYFGQKQSRGGFYQICFDCNPNVQNPNFQNIDALDQSIGNGPNPPVALYSKQFTVAQSHSIYIVNRKDTRASNNVSQISLDRLIITVDGDSGSSSASPSATGNQNPNSHKSSGDTIAIVVPIIIGVLLLALLVAFLVIRRKRRKSQEKVIREIEQQMKEASYVEAFYSQGDEAPSKTSAPRSQKPPLPAQDTNHANDVHGEQTDQVSNSAPAPSTSRRERDAGSLHESDVEETILPPDYLDATRNRKT